VDGRIPFHLDLKHTQNENNAVHVPHLKKFFIKQPFWKFLLLFVPASSSPITLSSKNKCFLQTNKYKQHKTKQTIFVS
jgi:hypothetical protein